VVGLCSLRMSGSASGRRSAPHAGLDLNQVLTLCWFWDADGLCWFVIRMGCADWLGAWAAQTGLCRLVGRMDCADWVVQTGWAYGLRRLGCADWVVQTGWAYGLRRLGCADWVVQTGWAYGLRRLGCADWAVQMVVQMSCFPLSGKTSFWLVP
jgi:hypothetical protein